MLKGRMTMVSQKMLALGTTRSCIRELFEYGLQQAAIVARRMCMTFPLAIPPCPPRKR